MQQVETLFRRFGAIGFWKPLSHSSGNTVPVCQTIFFVSDIFFPKDVHHASRNAFEMMRRLTTCVRKNAPPTIPAWEWCVGCLRVVAMIFGVGHHVALQVFPVHKLRNKKNSDRGIFQSRASLRGWFLPRVRSSHPSNWNRSSRRTQEGIWSRVWR